MKKVLYFILFTVVFCFISCDQYIAKQYGGDATINLKPGEKLVEVTWKGDAELWYLVEPMDSNYTPKTKVFKESSNLGIIEGSVTFVETR